MKKRIKQIIIYILVICSFCSLSFGTSMLDLTQKQEETEAGRREASKELEIVQTELSNTMIELQEMNQQISNYEIEIMQLNYRMGDLESSITNLLEELEKSVESFNRQQDLLKQRLITLYEAGETSYLDILVQSKSISDFLSNYYIISEITKYDVELLESIEQEKISIETRKKTLEGQKEQLKQAKSSKEETAIMLSNLKVMKNKYINQLSIAEIELQEKVDRYNKEMQEIESEILRATYESMGTDYAGGIMAWPTPGYTTITSPFGDRIHPIFKVPRFHPGTDIAIPTGGRVIAVNDGVVIKTTYTEAYGYMVMVDHGGGIVTLYAHASEIVVNVGDQVKRGDQVIKAGSTGWSTGPHLHFEVRVNGTCVDPMTFISSKANEQQKTENQI